MDTKKSRELWDRLENEPERAYWAFECFLALPSGERTILEAYRSYVGNPQAVKTSDTWSGWSRRFAWRERAAAYDKHLARVRREAYERGIEGEAERQGVLAERIRGRMNELMALGYEQAIEWFENAQPSDLRPQDIIQIMRLHMDAVKAFEVNREPEEAGWTEEDDARFADRMQDELDLDDTDHTDGDGFKEAEGGKD